jgi:hypothetical protein
VYVAVLPTDAVAEVGASARLPRAIYEALGGDRAAVVVLTPRSLSAFSSVTSNEVGKLANAARSSVRRPDDRAPALRNLVDGVVGVTSGADRDTGLADQPAGSPAGSGSGGGAGLVLLGLLAAGAAGLFLMARSRRRARAAADAERFAEVRTAAEEDVTRLGEDVAGLDLDLADPRLDEATRADYRRALDAYDAAKAALEQARRPEDLQSVSGALEEGRYAMACVRARLAGQPLPERRPPCFFNPQHGPSATDVEWAPPGGAPRVVPVCARDAERLLRGEDPDTREVLVGGQRRPYWEAGPAYGPWAGGYYGGFGMGGLLPGLLIGSMLGGGLGHGGSGESHAGSDAGSDSGGGGDFGGWDEPRWGGDGGGDFGGGDFGGGDFGGGDF